MKKIIFFIGNFLPGYRAGGPVTSIANLSTLLNKDFDITIVTSNKDFGVDTPYKEIEFDKKVKYKDFNIIYLSIINSKTVLNVIENENPDLIYLNSFFSTFTQLVLFVHISKRLIMPIILAPRGELQENALAIKALKKKVYLTVYKLMKVYKQVSFHATDKIEHDRIKNMFKVDDISTLPNVPKVSDKTPLYKGKNELKIIFISRIRDNKNLLLALQALFVCKGNLIFDIYGPIEDQSYWRKCQLIMGKLPKNIITEYKGIVSPTEVPAVMRKYHALLLPTKTENFGHVIVEAMQSGVVPIISDQTPWIKLAEYKAGWSLDLKDVNEFTKVINILYKMDSETYLNLSKNTMKFINKKLNINELKQKYILFLVKILNFNKGK